MTDSIDKIGKIIVVINNRIKDINNELIRNKRVWRNTENARRNLIDTAPTYGNEFDYSHEMGHEDQKKLNDLESTLSSVVGKKLDLNSERKYLKQLLRGIIPEFPRRYRGF